MLTAVRDVLPKDFLDNAGPLLYRDEPSNSLMLGLCGNLLNAKETPKTPPVFIRILRDGRTVTAAVQTPPSNLVITFARPEELEFLAKYLKEIGVEFPGVVGPATASETFSMIWSQLCQKSTKLAMGQKIYKIEKVIMPTTLGRLRLAQLEEVDLIAQWLVEFSEESLPTSWQQTRADRHRHAARVIENQQAYVWLVDEKPVSMAYVGRPTQNGISISAVYTPHNFRRQGFASAIVAHLSQKMLDSGKMFCVLYTDLSNPTSNKIYQSVGYRAVTDSKHFLFGVGDV